MTALQPTSERAYAYDTTTTTHRLVVLRMTSTTTAAAAMIARVRARACVPSRRPASPWSPPRPPRKLTDRNPPFPYPELPHAARLSLPLLCSLLPAAARALPCTPGPARTHPSTAYCSLAYVIRMGERDPHQYQCERCARVPPPLSLQQCIVFREETPPVQKSVTMIINGLLLLLLYTHISILHPKMSYARIGTRPKTALLCYFRFSSLL